LSGSNWRSERCESSLDTKQCYLEGSRALEQPLYEEMKHRSTRMTNAANSSWETPQQQETSSSSSSNDLTSGEFELRRNAIVFLFAKFGYPPEAEWGHGFGVIKDIMTKLEIPSNSRTSVSNVLIAEEAEDEFERLDAARLQHELLAFAVVDDDEDGDDDGGDNDELEDREGEADEDAALALDPDSDEDDIQGGGNADNDVG